MKTTTPKQIPFMLMLMAASLILVLPSCHKDPQPDPNPHKTMDDLKVPAGFRWETTHEVNLSVSVDLPDQIGSLARIKIYDGNPLEKGNLLISGSAGYHFPMTTALRIPTALKQLYLELTTGGGMSQIVAVNVETNIQYTFQPSKSPYKNYNNMAEPDCNSGCTVTLSGSGSTTISGGKIYCVTGTYSGTVTSGASAATLRVCGTATLSLLKVNTAGCNIIVTSGGTLTIDSLYMSSTSTLTVYQTGHASIRGVYMAINSKIINYSNDFTFQAPFSFNGEVQNYGNMILKGNATLGGTGGKLANSGYFNAQGWFKVNAALTNDGIIEVNKYLHLNKADGPNGTIVNNCQMIGHDNIHIFGATFLMNNGYLRSDLELHLFQYTSLVTLQNQSMMSANTFVMERNILGQGGTSSVKVTGLASLLDASKKFDGPIELATTNGLLSGSTSANFINGATLKTIAGAKNYIPVSSCNPEGIGQPVPPDNDGDGVPDNLDEFPSDPMRAYTNYYPSKDHFGSLGFEDLWPGRGDYDMNDLVIDYSFKVISNGQNKIVEIFPTFYVRAVGATLQNGFGFQFDGVDPATVESVTGYSLKETYINLAASGIENNQEKAVVIAFDNAENVIHRISGSYFNTMKDVPYGVSDTLKMHIRFTNAMDPADVGTAPYNPFLIKDKNRGMEVHMPDRLPTSLANPEYFGTGDDDSQPAIGRYYKTKSNLPWAVNLPERFDYTWELVPVINGYLNFGSWAESGGSSFPDWYKNIAGYRNATQIYTKPAK